MEDLTATRIPAQEAPLETPPKAPPGILYDLNERPPLAKWVAFAAQHLMVGFAVMIGVPLAFSAIVGLTPGQQTVFVSGVLVAGGVVTLLQAIGLGPIGARLPLVNSTTFKFLGPLTLAYKAGGFGAVYGAAIISGFITAALGVVVGRIQRIFTPFVVGAFLIITGTSLMPIALTNLLAVGKDYEAKPAALIAGAVPLAVMIYLSTTGASTWPGWPGSPGTRYVSAPHPTTPWPLRTPEPRTGCVRSAGQPCRGDRPAITVLAGRDGTFRLGVGRLEPRAISQ